MPAYKMVVAYDGTSYHGWQIQPDQPTITGILQQRFQAVFKKEIKITGASRTDAGVHALGQVAIFSLDTAIDASDLIFAWNNALPSDVLIRSLVLTSDDFHPQRNVETKTYHYHFFQDRPFPFVGRYGFFCSKVDLKKLEEGLAFFVGTHDFRSFCTGHEAESTIRTITEIDIFHFKRYGVYRIAVTGPGFLRYMIRRIVGACLDVASHQGKQLSELSEALTACDPHQHLHVAPPHGLMLHHITYK